MAFPKLGLVGCGSLGSALVRGWLAGGVETGIVIYSRDPSRIPARIGTSALAVTDDLQSPELAACDCLVLGVKPQILRTLAERLAPLTDGKAVVSLAAGLDREYLLAAFPRARAIVRALPNLAVERRNGLTVLCAGRGTAEDAKSVEQLFAPTGGFAWVETDAEVDVATAVSGSGLAFFYAFSEALARSSVAAGLKEELANRLAVQTLIGAGSLVETLEDAGRWKRAVTSPAGTTAAGLAVLEGGQGLDTLLGAAVRAAITRAQELRAG